MSWTPILGCFRICSRRAAASRSSVVLSNVAPSNQRLLSASCVAEKSKNSYTSAPPPTAPGDVPVINTKGKSAKGASKSSRGTRSKSGQVEEDEKGDNARYATSTKNQELPGEGFEEGNLRANMQRAVQRCKDAVNRKVSSYGRADSSMLDSILISFTPPGTPSGEAMAGATTSGRGGGAQSYPLRDFASVGVKDGALLVTCFDEESVKYVERAIYTADLGLTPQHVSGVTGVLRLPIPRPTAESRTALLKEVNRMCENARVSIRSARHIAQKQIQSDQKAKVISADEAKKEMKTMEKETKKHSSDIDQFLEKTKKRIEQG